MARLNAPRIRFLGAAGTVTGSKYLITSNESQLLVDCGLFQGLKELRLKNWDRFPIDPSKIEAIVLTHAHIDHSGYIPRLIKEGFKGKIYCTPATLELCRILLPDTGYLQEEDARWLNKKKLSKHSPALPLFTQQDAEESLKQFVPIEFNTPFQIGDQYLAHFKSAGHILGAAILILETNQVKIAFSGDLGRLNDPIFRDPETLPVGVNYLVVESTYGNRAHEKIDQFDELESIINEAVAKKGVLLVPAFAVGRAQSLIYYISELMKQQRIPQIPVYLNSPMASNVTEIFCKFLNLHKLTSRQCEEFTDVVHFVKSPEESKNLNEKKGPMIIISASGMITGGRILHHLKAFAGDPKNTILLAGFQAAGTRGRQIQDGAREVKFHGHMLPINAKVVNMENVSAHADYMEILKWLEMSDQNPRKVFITHGEVQSAFKMKEHIENKFHWNCFVPAQDQEFSLE